MQINWRSFSYHWTKPPSKQFPVGMVVYKGLQGKGKSLSMTVDAYNIKAEFPMCNVYSNMMLKGIKYNFISNNADLINALNTNNGSDGTLFVLDEAQNLFNKKSGVPFEVMAQFCQNRKNRRCILMTTQIWEDLDVMLRKQVKTVVNCNCILGKIQINTYHNGEELTYDKMSGEYVAPKKFTRIFKHNDIYYNRYDTLEVITTNKNYDRTLTMAQGSPPAPVSAIISTRTNKKGIL